MHTDKDKLTAVLAKWLEPMASEFFGDKIVASFPIVEAIDNKVRASGWVSPSWSIMSEIEPLIGNASLPMLRSAISGFVVQLPEEGLPEMAHGIVDKAMEMGTLSIMEGRVIFEHKDLERLKRLLDLNLPHEKPDEYIVVEA